MIAAIKAAAMDISALRGATAAFLSREYAVYDWERITLFTGSRISEYGQASRGSGNTQTSSSKSFATVPSSAAAGIWAGTSLAFRADDFTFWDVSMCRLDSSVLSATALSGLVCEVHVRFRFDKSKNNFTIRKYRRQADVAFDLVSATLNVFNRARLLGIPPDEPLAQYRRPNGTMAFLRDLDVRDVLRAACIRAYPDPTHYCRINIAGLVTHSNRVTAALCLSLGGASIDEIAFRLRWEPGSVPTYLRECFVGIDTIMQRAIAGSFCLQ